MKTSTVCKIMACVALLSIATPSIADNYNRQYSSNNYYRYNNRQQNRHFHQAQRNWQRNQVNASNNWNWDRHNWNDQRAQLRANWQVNNNRISAAQQQQLDAQMRAQWLQYHNNNWNGQTSWNQYSDPRFLDYVHNNNPSLLTSLRSRFGF